MNSRSTVDSRLPHQVLPLLVVLIAFGFRVWALDVVPPGLTHDEAAHLQDAQRIWNGDRPVYLTTAYGREPLYDYASAPLVGLIGMGVSIGRLSTAFWGTLLVALLYAWAKRAFDWPTAALATAVMACSFWPVSTSRQILRSITMPSLLTAAILLFWSAAYAARGRRRQGLFAVAGLLLGLSFYTYMPARITWLIPALYGLSLVSGDRARWRQVRLGLGLMLLVMAAVAAPLLAHLITHPELEVRVSELGAPLRALWGGELGPLGDRLAETALLFSHRGDVQWIYNIAGRPLLCPALAILFYSGVAVAVFQAVRQRRRACFLVLMWLALGAVPALVTGLESSALRAIAAQPAVFLLIALPLSTLGRGLWPRISRRGRLGFIGLTGVALALLAARTARDYFFLWGSHPDTRVAYHSHLVEIARYLDARPEETPVGVSTIYPAPLHDPYAVDVIIRRADLKEALRWYDARSALVFPDAERARAVFPALAPLDPALRPAFEPVARLVERVELRADDLSPWFEVYEWRPRAARAALPLGEPADLGHTLALAGVDLRTPIVPAGGMIEVITYWTPLVASPAGEELVLFTHLLDGEIVVGQQDRLDVPAAFWRPGDLFAQLHRFSVPPDLPAGRYPLETGVYLRVEGYPRLPVYDGGQEVGDRVLLPEVEVVPGLE